MDMDGHAAREAAAAHILAQGLRARGGKASVESATCNPQKKSALLESGPNFRAVFMDCQRSSGPPSRAGEPGPEDGGL